MAQQITKDEIEKVFTYHITKDEKGRWRSIFPETNTHKCKINREIRMKAINAYLEDDSKSLFDNWKLVGQFTLADDEQRECLCGHSNNVEYYIKHSSGEIVVLGSRCIEALHKKFGGGGEIISQLDWNCEKCNRRKAHKTKGGKYLPYCAGGGDEPPYCEIMDMCSKCKGNKNETDQYCGGAICSVEYELAERRRQDEIRQREMREAVERAIRETAERQARLDEQNRLDRERRLCGKCNRIKDELNAFCGGTRCIFRGCHYCKAPVGTGKMFCGKGVCINCIHGPRIAYNRNGKKGWLCGCPSEQHKCAPIWKNRDGWTIRGTPH